MLPNSTICAQCPFRRTSAPGYLGSDTPERFIDATLSENDMPCHMAVDYDDEDWESDLEDIPRCAGSLVFFRNNCKLPRTPELCDAVSSVKPDRETVFSFKHEFLEHHGTKKKTTLKKRNKTS